MISTQLQSGDQIAERYRLEQLIGSGGMAAVWLARDERLDRPVALKLLAETLLADTDFLARFEREAQIAAALSHPNLVTIYDVGAVGERPYLVMEYVAGETLAGRLERDPDRIDARATAAGLLAALGHIHSAGIVHRDVKPANVLFDDRDEPRLTDFGIARRLDGGGGITRTGQVLGTLRYLAPEIAEGGRPTARSDLYSLGVVLDEIGAADPALGDVIDRLRDPDPDLRPESAASALAMLDPDPRSAAARLGPVRGSRTATAEAAPGPPPRRTVSAGPRRGPIAAAVAVAVAAVVAGAFALGGGEETGPTNPPERERAGGNAADTGEEGSGSGGGGVPAPAPDPDPARGAQLNDEGFALLGAGQAEDAVPVLRRAVASFPQGTDDLTYAYALYNLGRALRLAGQPDEAVPVLERRLRIDNQRETVRRELRRARAEADD